MPAEYRQIKFSDEDVVNPTDYIPAGEYNPHRVRPWLLHDHGFVVAIVFADSLQTALDEAADHDKLTSFQVSEDDLADYGENEDSITRLGNAGVAYDIEALDVLELPNPAFSFAAVFQAMQSHKAT